MINITSYTEFINEEFFSRFRKPKPQIVEEQHSEAFLKLMKMIEEIDPRQITKKYVSAYTITKKIHSSDENDPYGEEIYDEDIIIEIGYYCYINNDRIPLLKNECRLLFKAIDDKYHAHDENEKNMRIKNALDKL